MRLSVRWLKYKTMVSLGVRHGRETTTARRGRYIFEISDCLLGVYMLVWNFWRRFDA